MHFLWYIQRQGSLRREIEEGSWLDGRLGSHLCEKWVSRTRKPDEAERRTLRLCYPDPDPPGKSRTLLYIRSKCPLFERESGRLVRELLTEKLDRIRLQQSHLNTNRYKKFWAWWCTSRNGTPHRLAEPSSNIADTLTLCVRKKRKSDKLRLAKDWCWVMV